MAIEQLSYSAAEIDERLGRVSGDNLLINPFFQINQRGQSSYSGAGYGLDGWLLANNGTVDILGVSQVKFTASAGSATFVNQRLEVQPETGDFYTFSVTEYNGNIYSFTAALKPENMGTTSTPWGSIRIEWSSAYGYFVTIAIAAGNSVTLKCAKLDLGEVSTLANDAPPKIGTDLAECQRYLSPLPQHFVGWASSTTEIISVVPLPTTMRITPSLSNTDASQYRCRGNGENNIPTGINIIMDASNSIRIMFTGTFTQNEVYYIYAPPGVMLSAEL